jgi:hypothetical protein
MRPSTTGECGDVLRAREPDRSRMGDALPSLATRPRTRGMSWSAPRLLGAVRRVLLAPRDPVLENELNGPGGRPLSPPTP